MKNKNATIVSIVLIIIAALVGVYFIIYSRVKVEYIPNYNLDDTYVFPERIMNVNEYQPVRVTEKDMIKTYFNTYVTLYFEDIDRAYSFLDDNEVKNYPTIDSFKTKVSLMTNNLTEMPSMKGYTIESDKKTGNQIYRVKDKNGNITVFIVEAVMKYRVMFE